MLNMIQDIAKFIFNPIFIVVIILIFLLKYWSDNLNAIDTNYQKYIYIQNHGFHDNNIHRCVIILLNIMFVGGW